MAFFSTWILLACLVNFYGYVDFEEENDICLTISENEDPSGCVSGIISSPENLLRYLDNRAFNGYLTLEGDLVIDSLDFANYDYVFSEGRPILRIERLLWDQCSSYDHSGLSPVGISFGDSLSHKVYIYKIKPKHKYRVECG